MSAFLRHRIPLTRLQLSPFDVTFSLPAIFPVLHQETFFNQPWVQAELGVPLNFTMSNPNIVPSFFGAGDPARVDMSFLSHVLQSNVNVAMVFGDRDARCNCMSPRSQSLLCL